MRYPAFICILLSLLPFTGNRLFAQDTDPRDSLNALLETRLSDQQEVDVYNQLAFYNFDVNDSMAMIYAKTAHKLANAARYTKGEKYATTLIGLGLSSAGEHKEAITYFKKSHELTVADSENIASYNLLIWGTLHAETGNYDSALTLYTQARKLAKSPADLQSIYKNMARVYIQVWKNELAIQYLDSASLPTMGADYMQIGVH
jgi:tetratricopeptide (TPR) repeat protein